MKITRNFINIYCNNNGKYLKISIAQLPVRENNFLIQLVTEHIFYAFWSSLYKIHKLNIELVYHGLSFHKFLWNEMLILTFATQISFPSFQQEKK